MATTTSAFLLSGLRSPRPRARVAPLSAVPWVPPPHPPQLLSLGYKAFSLVPHPSALLHPLSSPPGFSEPRGSGGSGDAMGTRPNSLSSAVTWGDKRRGGSGRRGLAGSAGPAAFISLGLRPPSSPLFSPPPGGWEGTGRDAGSREGGEGSTEPVTCLAAVWTSRGLAPKRAGKVKKAASQATAVRF